MTGTLEEGSDPEMEEKCRGRSSGANDWSKIVNRKRKKTFR